MSHLFVRQLKKMFGYGSWLSVFPNVLCQYQNANTLNVRNGVPGLGFGFRRFPLCGGAV